MRTIYKFHLQTTDVQKINIPGLIGSNSFKDQVLCINVQNEEPYIWCLVDEQITPGKAIMIQIVGTGSPMPSLNKDSYLGSYMLYNGAFVGHVFETTEECEEQNAD